VSQLQSSGNTTFLIRGFGNGANNPGIEPSVGVFIRGEYVYDDKLPVIENVPAEIASREVNMLNASIGLGGRNGLELLLWGRNLTDDEFLQSAFPAVAQNGS
jgi:iron complex outermembrane receptor protein